MNNKSELIISALQQRIGEMTINYETQIALLRAELTILSEEKNELSIEKEKAAIEYSNSIDQKLLEASNG